MGHFGTDSRDLYRQAKTFDRTPISCLFKQKETVITILELNCLVY